MHHGRIFCKSFGKDSPLARQLASIKAGEVYKDILMGKSGITKEAKTLKFKEATKIFYKRHYEDYRDPTTNAPRSEHAKQVADSMLFNRLAFFNDFYLHEIKVADVKRYKEKRLSFDKVENATFNREKGILAALFNQFKSWIAEELIDPIKLPDVNPCEFVQTLQENKRERVPDTWELAEAYTWCQTNDYGLWEAIESALLTALRKADLIALDNKLTVKGIQQKTGEKFDLPIVLDKPVDLSDFNKRWNALRTAMGWMKNQAKHTTWHDLRHWAPTLLGEQGFSIKIIQHYTGHKKEETAERYTNIRRKALEPAVKTVREAIERLKDEA